MHPELTGLNHCAVPFLSRAAVNLCMYYYTLYIHCTLTVYNAHLHIVLWGKCALCIFTGDSVHYALEKVYIIHWRKFTMYIVR